MPGLDLATCETKLTEYLEAETAVLGGQVVSVDGDQFTLADLDKIQKGIELWNARVVQRSHTRRSLGYGVSK